jgi:prepilin peptidase CpaA
MQIAGSPEGLVIFALQAAYAFCICYAIVSDFKHLRIPNWIPIALAAAFVLYAVLALDHTAVLDRILLAACVFLAGTVLFAAGWLGGGDVKLLAAIALWTGLENTAPLLLLMSALGAGLALLLMFMRSNSGAVLAWTRSNPLVARLVELGDSGKCPYGVAIGVAALLIGNQVTLAA